MDHQRSGGNDRLRGSIPTRLGWRPPIRGIHSVSMESSASLRIEFTGVIHVVPNDGEVLVFGRGAPLDIDNNPFLHRNLARIFQ